LITESKNVYSFGGNNFGQLGLGNTKSYSTPQLINNFMNSEIIKV